MKKNPFVKTVFVKELTDILRDRKTLITSLLLPLVLYPMMFLFMGSAMGSMIDAAQENTTVAIIAQGEVRAYLEDDVLASIPGVVVMTFDDPMAALDNGDVKLVLRSDMSSLPAAGAKLDFSIVYNSKKSDSSNSLNYLHSQLLEYNSRQAEASLREMGIDLDALSPLRIVDAVPLESVKAENGEESNGGSGSAGMMLEMLLPMMVVIFLAVGALAPAADMFAGEKERKTMEPLLCTRAGRGQILSGKFFAITVFSILTVAVSILGMALGYIVNPSAMMMSVVDGAAMTLTLPVSAVLLLFLLIAMIAMTFAGLYSSISVYAKTIKEASTYGSYVMLICYIPAFSTIFIQSGDVALWMMLVPVLNVVGSIKMILGGLVNYGFLACALASTAVFLGAVLLFARSLFKKETIMLRM